MNDNDFIGRAIELARQHCVDGLHGPFGAVVVRNNVIIGEGWNSVVDSRDPTAHAEMMAIRAACKSLDNHDLEGCSIYSSCEPCPMCLAAIRWARLDRIVFACTREDAAAAGFDDETILREIRADWSDRQVAWQQVGRDAALEVFKEWSDNADSVMY